MNYKLTHNHYAFAAVALWSSTYPLTGMVAPYYSASSLGLLRCLVASAVLAGVVFGRGLALPPRSIWPRFFILGLTGLSVYLILYNQGQYTLGATTGCIVISTSPIVTALLARVFFGERLTWLGWLAIIMAFCGIVVMTLWDGVLAINRGIFWVQAAAILISVYNILQKRLAGAGACGPVQATAYCYFAGALQLLVFLPGALSEFAAAPAWAVAAVVYMGVFPSALGYLFWIQAMGRAQKTSQVANFMFLTPFLAMLLELALAARLPDAGTVIGGAVILAGLALFARAGRKKTIHNS